MPSRQALNLNNLKQTPIPVVPANLQLVNGDGTVTRSGKLLLQQLQASGTLQGTHAGRPAPGDAPDGALYVESDRLVIYSNIDGAWHYIAGTDWGTINPDQRPTDLGVNDAGFDFRTVDQPAREFIWSQAYWVEVTPVRYGTHAQRLSVNVSRVIEQMLWVETDRGALYQLMQVSGPAPVWQYIAGTMFGTLSPDQRPTDLGTHDAGFDFRGTDQQREFIWSQAAWVEVTPPPANTVQIAYASSGLTLTTAYQTIPGTTLTLSAAGKYLVTGTFFFSVSSGDTGAYILGGIGGAGTFNSSVNALLNVSTINASTSFLATVSQQWLYVTSAPNTTVLLQAYKTGGTGATTVGATHTSISALFVSP